jgi:sugar phosphate isomerase/epimerase
MHASMSTISWMTFPEPGPPAPAGPPFAAAPLGEIVAAAREAGFAAVGLDSVTLGPLLGSRDGADEVAAIVDGLVVSDVGVLRVGLDDPTAAATALAGLAARVGATLCPTVVEVPPDAALLGRLRTCAEVLRPAGVRMALEFMAHGPLATLTDAVDVCEGVGWDDCGLLLDSWHLMHAGTAWDEVATLRADQVALVQVSDGARLASGPAEFFTASRWGRRPPGQGTFDFEPFLRAVAATGYDGWLSPEVLSYGASVGDPVACARELRAATDLLGAP